MPSPAKQTETVRKHKLRTRGRARKNKLNNTGTTPSRAALFKVVG